MTNNSRYEVIAPMPYFTHLFKGDILYPKVHALCGDCWGYEDEDNVQKWVTFCPDYPHLFRLLKWWEGLAIDELPKYVKDDTVGKIVIKVHEYHIKDSVFISFANRNSHYPSRLDIFVPATEAEYQDYITKLNAK